MQLDRPDLNAIAMGEGGLTDDGLPVEHHRLRGREFADPNAIGSANHLTANGRKIGAGNAQIAAGHAADEEFLAGHIVPSRSCRPMAEFEPHEGGIGAGRHQGGMSHTGIASVVQLGRPSAVTFLATRPRNSTRQAQSDTGAAD